MEAASSTKAVNENRVALAIVLDVRASLWSDLSSGITLSSVVEALLSVAGTIALMDPKNEVSIFATTGCRAHLVLSTHLEADLWRGNPTPPLRLVMQKLRDLAMCEAEDAATISERGPESATGIVAAVSTAVCHLHRVMQEAPVTPPGRVLVATAGPDAPQSYVSLMNAVFAAHNIGAAVDAAHFGGVPSHALQQAASETGGRYHAFHAPTEMWQRLFFMFADTPFTRTRLAAPSVSKVSAKAACAVTGQPVNIGLVCSACMTILKAWRPECPLCGSEFDPADRPDVEFKVALGPQEAGWS